MTDKNLERVAVACATVADVVNDDLANDAIDLKRTYSLQTVTKPDGFLFKQVVLIGDEPFEVQVKTLTKRK